MFNPLHGIVIFGESQAPKCTMVMQIKLNRIPRILLCKQSEATHPINKICTNETKLEHHVPT